MLFFSFFSDKEINMYVNYSVRTKVVTDLDLSIIMPFTLHIRLIRNVCRLLEVFTLCESTYISNRQY